MAIIKLTMPTPLDTPKATQTKKRMNVVGGNDLGRLLLFTPGFISLLLEIQHLYYKPTSGNDDGQESDHEMEEASGQDPSSDIASSDRRNSDHQMELPSVGDGSSDIASDVSSDNDADDEDDEDEDLDSHIDRLHTLWWSSVETTMKHLVSLQKCILCVREGYNWHPSATLTTLVADLGNKLRGLGVPTEEGEEIGVMALDEHMIEDLCQEINRVECSYWMEHFKTCQVLKESEERVLD